jgi:hypothetical protein
MSSAPVVMLAMTMGTGKTRVTIEFSKLFLTKNEVVFLCPTKTRDHVCRELNRWGWPKDTRTMHVQSYATFTRSGHAQLLAGSKNNNITLIIDESSKLVGCKALHRALKTLRSTRTVEFTVLLTGTPGAKCDIKKQVSTLTGETTDVPIHRLVNLPKCVHEPCYQTVYVENTLREARRYDEIKTSYLSETTKGTRRLQLLHQLRKQLSSVEAKRAMCKSIVATAKSKFGKNVKIAIVSEFSLLMLKMILVSEKRSRFDFYSISADNTQQPPPILFLRRADLYGRDLGDVRVMILMEPLWRVEDQSQARARITRIGNVADQHTIQLIVKDTLEDRLFEANANFTGQC